MRRRLVLAIAAVATGAVLLLAVPLGIVLGRGYHDKELLRLQRDTAAATRGVDLGPGARDPVELPASRDLLAAYDRAGRRVSGDGPPSASALVRQVLRNGRLADAEHAGAIEVVVPIIHNEEVTGAVRAVRSDGAAAGAARRAWLTLLAVALAIIALAVLAALILGRGLAGPLERLAVSARRLGDGDFSVRAAPAGVAEVDAVGAALDTTAQRLDGLVLRERAFTADASHQLRTPLQALRIELEAIELRGDHPPELPAALAQVDRLQSTVDTLLSAARDAPREAPASAVAPILDEARARWHGRLAQDGRPLRITGGADAEVRAAAPVVQEVLDVLLDNAATHGAGAVTLSVRCSDDHVWFDVADEGAGFAVDPVAAFERRAGGGNGHGIGLALARSLAHGEGGRVEVVRSEARPVLSLLLPRRARGGDG
ncbi:MAG: HAMP domain-containing sensor histidine kinase [Solirubrobacteraceae bacterium]